MVEEYLDLCNRRIHCPRRLRVLASSSWPSIIYTLEGELDSPTTLRTACLIQCPEFGPSSFSLSVSTTRGCTRVDPCRTGKAIFDLKQPRNAAQPGYLLNTHSIAAGPIIRRPSTVFRLIWWRPLANFPDNTSWVEGNPSGWLRIFGDLPHQHCL
ncbi:hypothetical protein BDZ97DRAFT_1804295, partial [Flammula alnicola]